MSTPKVVIGAGYGDEGKGLITDYLCSKYGADLVVRFNGGGQAGHTVETDSGERFVFGHLSAGSFTGASTFLSSFFVMNPFVFLRELNQFHGMVRSTPTTYVDHRVQITTPYDMLINQLVEQKRDKQRHGSCGLGFGETIERNLNEDDFTLRFEHLSDKKLFESKLEKIRDVWFPKRCEELNLDPKLGEGLISSKNLFNNFIEDSLRMKDLCVETGPEIILESFQTVFEGAQGLLLDQKYGSFPHVTRSNTGLKNVFEIYKDIDPEFDSEIEFDVTYVTRCYATRHGAGPLSNEVSKIEGAYDETNVFNRYQGELRYGYLNLDILKSAINYDISYNRDYKVNAGLAVTCLDQPDGIIKVSKNGSLETFRSDQYSDIGDLINAAVGLNGHLIKSYGPTRSTIIHLP